MSNHSKKLGEERDRIVKLLVQGEGEPLLLDSTRHASSRILQVLQEKIENADLFPPSIWDENTDEVLSFTGKLVGTALALAVLSLYEEKPAKKNAEILRGIIRGVEEGIKIAHEMEGN